MKRPESHRIGELGEIRASELFTEAGWVVTPVRPDYGLDLLIERTDGDTPTGEIAFVQVKATRRGVRNSADGQATCHLSADSLGHLTSRKVPSVLLLVDLDGKREYISDCMGKAFPVPASQTIPVRLVDEIMLSEMSRSVQQFWHKIWLIQPEPERGKSFHRRLVLSLIRTLDRYERGEPIAELEELPSWDPLEPSRARDKRQRRLDLLEGDLFVGLHDNQWVPV